MTPGPSEEIGQTARSFFEVMKTQPAVLALIVANMALLFFIYYALQSAAVSRNQLVTQILDNSNAIHALLQQRAIGCPDTKEKPP
jgi:membrane-anchored glycerophosphoryl diester phosphodiesterase (GDPDase)